MISATWPRTIRKTWPARSVKGLIQPIRKHTTYPEIEQAAFAMADGEVSKVIAAGGQYVILKRECAASRPATSSSNRSRRELEKVIRDRKMRSVADEIFEQLQKRSVVENVFNDPVEEPAHAGRGRRWSTARRSPSASWPRSASTATARRFWKARSTAG